MTDTNTKVRSLILTALMVVSVFGGSIAFAGSAAAANTGSGSVSPASVDAGSTTEVTISYTAQNFQSDSSSDEVTFTLNNAEVDSVNSVTVTDAGSSNDLNGQTNDVGSNTIDVGFNTDNLDSSGNNVDIEVVADVSFSSSDVDVDAAIDENSNGVEETDDAFATFAVSETTVTINDQNRDAPVDSVTVDSVTLENDGYVAIHETPANPSDGTPADTVIGVSQYLEAGTYSDVTIDLFSGVPGASFDRDSLNDGETVVAMPHEETNGNEEYNFVSSDGSADGAYTSGGSAVTDSAVVSYDNTLDDSTTYFQGQELVQDTNVEAGEELEIRYRGGDNAGQLVTQVTANSDALAVIDTSSLPADQFTLTDSNEDVSVEFEIVTQDLTVSADPTSVNNADSSTSTDITVTTNRAGDTMYTVSAENLTASDLFTVDDADADMDGFQIDITQGTAVNADFDGIDAGNYSLTFDAVDTTASDSTSVEASQPAEGTVSLEDTIFSEDRGDVAQITVNLENTDSATLVVGSDSVNYAADVEVTDGDGDGTVTVNLNTFRTTEGPAAFTAESSDDSAMATGASDYDSDATTSGPLAAADYDIVLQNNDNDVGVGTLVVSERSTDSMQLWTSADLSVDAGQGDVYDGIEAGTITQDNTIANQDEVVHQIEVSGVYGALTDEMDSDTTAEEALISLVEMEDDDMEGDDPFTLSATQAGNFPNSQPLTVDFEEVNQNDGLNVVADSANNTVFVALDTAGLFDDSTNPDPALARDGTDLNSGDVEPADLLGQTFDVEFGLIADNTELADEDETVTASFTVEERVAELNDGDDVTVEAAADQMLNGTTNIAPGTELNLRARASGDNPFLKTANSVVVSEDGTFSGTFDFSDASANTSFTLSASGLSVDGVSVDGTVVEMTDEPEDTPTPTPTDEPDTPTPTDMPTDEPTDMPTDTPTDMATDTPSDTEGSTPGFGGAVAIVALAGAALIALRREN